MEKKYYTYYNNVWFILYLKQFNLQSTSLEIISNLLRK